MKIPQSITISLLALTCVALVQTVQAAVEPPVPPPLTQANPPPAQIASSEGMQPLPYPATFQKRQEKKNPPTPPTLITKISVSDTEDWVRTPNDLRGFLAWLGKEMQVNGSSNIKAFGQISSEPQNNPILYRSGYKPFRLSQQEIEKLREFLLNGGTLIFNTLAGVPEFYESAREAAQEILPESVVYRLRMDHPAFSAYYNIDKVNFRPKMLKDGVSPDAYPWVEGIDIDNRTAIFISRWDFALGWEANPYDCWGYVDEDARKLGANLISYATAMREAGRSVGRSVELVNSEHKTAGKFRVGRVVHNAPWKTRPAAFPMLLNQFHEATGTPVSFEMRDVSLTDPAIFEMPFLYMTSTIDFQLTPEEVTALRKFLNNGGVLLAEAGEGRPSFNKAFREEMAKVLPGKPLQPLAARHDIFTRPIAIPSVQARPALSVKKGNQAQVAPELYGIELNGSLAVIYAPHDLSAGWEKALAPYALGYESHDATSLGLNILYYAITH